MIGALEIHGKLLALQGRLDGVRSAINQAGAQIDGFDVAVHPCLQGEHLSVFSRVGWDAEGRRHGVLTLVDSLGELLEDLAKGWLRFGPWLGGYGHGRVRSDALEVERDAGRRDGVDRHGIAFFPVVEVGPVCAA